MKHRLLAAATFVTAITSVGLALETAAERDFNGDGHMDLLLRNEQTGELALFVMNGTQLLAVPFINPSPIDLTWHIVGTGDFNADGKPDIVWQEQTRGDLGVWLMDFANRISFQPFAPVSRVADLGWKIAGVADLNGDGKSDLVWREQDHGWLAVWFMDGVTRIGVANLNPGTVDVNWEIVGNGDFNGDGQTDLLWRHRTSGMLIVWLMNGVTATAMPSLSPSTVDDLDWKVAATGDLNNDGHPDLIWEHQTRGWLAAWLMNGTTRVDAPSVQPGTNDPVWKIVGPK